MTLTRSSFVPSTKRVLRSRNAIKAPARRTRSGVAVKAEGDFERLNVVIVGAECAPFSKTGGLGDVVQSLPKVRARSILSIYLFPLPEPRSVSLRQPPSPPKPRADLHPGPNRIHRRSCVVATASCPSSPCTTTTMSATPLAPARSST